MKELHLCTKYWQILTNCVSFFFTNQSNIGSFWDPQFNIPRSCRDEILFNMEIICSKYIYLIRLSILYYFLILVLSGDKSWSHHGWYWFVKSSCSCQLWPASLSLPFSDTLGYRLLITWGTKIKSEKGEEEGHSNINNLIKIQIQIQIFLTSEYFQ